MKLFYFSDMNLRDTPGIDKIELIVNPTGYIGRLSSKLRLQMALRTDERVRFMDEIISGVQVIKMYAWETPFAKLIAMARKLELNVVRKVSYVRALFMTFALFTTRMAVFCTMLSIVLLYGSDQITAAKVFVITSYFGIVSQSVSQLFVRGVAELSETFVAFRRLQGFLEMEEKIKVLFSLAYIPFLRFCSTKLVYCDLERTK